MQNGGWTVEGRRGGEFMCRQENKSTGGITTLESARLEFVLSWLPSTMTVYILILTGNGATPIAIV